MTSIFRVAEDGTRNGRGKFPTEPGDGMRNGQDKFYTGEITMEKNEEFLYEIRREGRIMCTSPLPMCGYDRSKLREILAAGYRYYVNGKMQKKLQ